MANFNRVTTKPVGGLVRRFRRGMLLALLVGIIATMVSAVPALFFQSMFIGQAERCDKQQRFEQAALDSIETRCEEQLGSFPFWLTPSIIVGGGVVGILGGLIYGLVTVPEGRKPRRDPSQWLPF